MPQAFYILFGAAYTVAVCAALGRMLLARTGARLYREEQWLLGFVCGAPLASLIVFALAAAGVARKGVFLWVGAAILLAAWRAGAWGGEAEPLPPLPRFWKRLFGIVYGVYFFLYFTNAMAPEWSPDGSAYHLGLVSRYLAHRGFYHIPTNMYANLSQGLEMLFLFAFSFGRHSAAALVHCGFLLALPLLVLGYARRFGFAEAGAAAAIFVFASPVVGIDGSCAYNDVAVAAVAFTVFYLLQIWDQDRRPRLLAAIGLVAGFGYAVKYTAFTAVPYAVAFVAWKTWRKREPWMRAAATVGACALVSILPWMAKNWVYTRNPFSPFANALFPNPFVSPGFEAGYRQFLLLYELTSRWQIPLAVTTQGHLSGLLGPLFLLAPVALAVLRWRAGRQLLLAAAVFGSTYFGNIGARFLIPAAPFLALAMALAFVKVRGLAPALALLHALLSWPDVIPRYASPVAWRLAKAPYREALRIKPEEGYLLSNLGNYAITRLIERSTPPGAKILTFTPAADAYTMRDIVTVYQSTWGRYAGDVALMPLVADYQPTLRLRFRFAPRRLRSVRVVQTARGEPDFWSVGELRVFHGGGELPRAPQWRARAWPNPWFVQNAFDNSPVTRWTTEETLRPGMYLELDFGRPCELDAVLLEAAHDQYKIRLKLEGQDAAGRWSLLAAEPESSDGPPMLGMRRLAAEELKRLGFSYVLAYDSDFIAKDLRASPDLWGMEIVGRAGDGTLYRIL
ncbi:MAG: glycosyltransferase family 39 protein [Bryobacteraceae bacterium]